MFLLARIVCVTEWKQVSNKPLVHGRCSFEQLDLFVLQIGNSFLISQLWHVFL